MIRRQVPLRKILPEGLRLGRFFWPEITREKKLIPLSTLGVVMTVVLTTLGPWPLKYIFNLLFLSTGSKHSSVPPAWFLLFHTTTLLIGLASAMVLLAGLAAVSDYYTTILMTRAVSRIMSRIRSRLFTHVANLSLSFHARNRTGDLMARVTSDVDRLREVIVSAALPLVTNGASLLSMLGVMFWVNWRLGTIAVMAIPLFLFSSGRLATRIHTASGSQRKREGAMAATTAETISSMRVVQALSLQEKFSTFFTDETLKNQTEIDETQKLTAGLERLVELLVACTTAIILYLGAKMVLSGKLTPGDLVVFMSYLRTAFRPMRQLAKYLGQIAKALASGERIIELLETVPDIRDRDDAVEAPVFVGTVKFDNVSFGYDPEHLVLRGVSFEVSAGERLALAGPSGSGKSTIVSLLLRLYDPTDGCILIDGRDLREYKVQSLRTQLGVVMQESLLFDASLKENIANGARNASDEQIIESAKVANAHDFITRLPQGYNTMAGERGAGLSGGQKQRVAIARAVVRGAPILICDEPTTGLDQVNEREVSHALRNASQGRTALLVTHDLQAASECDRILYLENGVIIEQGSHTQLMQLDRRYAQVYRAAARVTNASPSAELVEA